MEDLMKKLIYFDHAATTPVAAEVFGAMTPYFSEEFANPSTLYSFGQQARAAIDQARAQVARLIGAETDEIFFTSGATEADNWAITGVVQAREKKGNHIITSAIEHHAVLETCEALAKRGIIELTVLPVDADGLVDPEDVRRAVTDKTVLITIMHSNNEIGVIEPIREIGLIARERGITFHTDATQSVGKIPVDVTELGCNMLSLSAHKLYGPKGAGALYIRKGTRILPFMRGGAQENNRRAGTLNVPGIVGLGKAAELAASTMDAEAARERAMRDRLIAGILSNIPDSRLNGHAQKRLPNNVNVSIEGIEGESMILRLDFAGFCVSSGSACTSGSLEASHVLLAIGLPHELAHGSLRISLGRSNTEEDVDKFLETFPKVVSLLRSMSPVYNSCPVDFTAE